MRRWLIASVALHVVAIVLAACSAGPEPIEPVGDDACERAETRLRMLECRMPDGTPWWETPDGTPFADVCRQRMRIGTNVNPHCIARLRDCGELEARYRGKLCE